ncbi:hypothetical protein N9N67_01640 [Bacteriovoracaceae bacterium]|nr:hypothetical protein [Bacteriovoracaceae bacterium]
MEKFKRESLEEIFGFVNDDKLVKSLIEYLGHNKKTDPFIFELNSLQRSYRDVLKLEQEMRHNTFKKVLDIFSSVLELKQKRKHIEALDLFKIEVLSKDVVIDNINNPCIKLKFNKSIRGQLRAAEKKGDADQAIKNLLKEKATEKYENPYISFLEGKIDEETLLKTYLKNKDKICAELNSSIKLEKSGRGKNLTAARDAMVFDLNRIYTMYLKSFFITNLRAVSKAMNASSNLRNDSSIEFEFIRSINNLLDKNEFIFKIINKTELNPEHYHSLKSKLLD